MRSSVSNRMRVAGLLLAAVVLLSCARSPVEHASSTPTSLAASSSRESVPPPSAVSFSCRLPVMTRERLSGGFIEFPVGNYVPDPTSTFTTETSTGRSRSISVQQPQLAGTMPLLFYDRATSRWLPTNREGVNPDGTGCAYVVQGQNQSVHVVDVATARERSFPAPHPMVGEVYDYSPNGIYLAGRGDGAEIGLWLLDPQSGSERLVTNEKVVSAVRDGKVWLGQRTGVTYGIFPDTLVELDLSSGSKTTWFHRENGQAWLVGLTSAGLPIVIVHGSPRNELWLVSSPGTEKRIYSSPNWFDFPSSDSHGVWFASVDGIYLYSDSNGFQKVSNLLGFPAGSCA